MEIVPGLFQLKTPMMRPQLPYIMPYAFRCSDGVALFDAGFGTPQATDSMTAQLKELGYEPKDIRRYFVSHAHGDHLGMVAWIKEQSPDCEVIMTKREAQWIKDRWADSAAWTKASDVWLLRHGIPQSQIDEAAAQQAAEAPRANNGRAPWWSIQPDVTLDDGDVVEFDQWRLQAVWTPGHTPGHMCMYELNTKVMFTGDHVLPLISPNVSLHVDQEGSSPLSDFRNSLKKVAAFDTSFALPAHEFTMPDLKLRCEILLHHHDDRLDEVCAAIGDGPTSASTVSSRVIWNSGTFEEFNLQTKRSALGETLSHLKLLEDTGRVRCVERDGALLWEQVG